MKDGLLFHIMLIQQDDSTRFSIRTYVPASHGFFGPVNDARHGFHLVDQALNQIKKCLAIPITFMPLLHQWLSLSSFQRNLCLQQIVSNTEAMSGESRSKNWILCHRFSDSSTQFSFLSAEAQVERQSSLYAKTVTREMSGTRQAQGFRTARATSKACAWKPCGRKELSLPEKSSINTLAGLGYTWLLHTRKLSRKLQVVQMQK